MPEKSIGLLAGYGPVAGVALVALLLAGLSVYLALVVVKQRKNGHGPPPVKHSGPERRVPDPEAREFRREALETLRRIDDRITTVNDKLNAVVTEVAVLKNDMEHLKRHCPLMERR